MAGIQLRIAAPRTDSKPSPSSRSWAARIDIEPNDALLYCVKRDAGRVSWLQLRVELLDPDPVPARSSTASAPPTARSHAPLALEAAQPRLDLSILDQVPDKGVILGVLDLGDLEIESVETIAERIRAGLRHVARDRLQVAPDCGMKYLPREIAFGKLQAMVRAADIVRGELAGGEQRSGDRRATLGDRPGPAESFPGGP
jgi:hypothetical protein